MRSDALLALFAPALAGQTPLVLDATEIEVELVPAMARVVITRRFTNRTDGAIEAVLASAPPARDEVIERVSVTVDGVVYEALRRPSTSKPAGNGALADRGPILYEQIDDEVQLVAIARIPARAEVAVSIGSVRRIELFGMQLGTLRIALGTDAGRVTPIAISPASSSPHALTLSMRAEGISVTVNGSAAHATSGQPLSLVPASQLTLALAAIGSTALDGVAAEVPRSNGTLVFPDARGELPDALPSLRALALPQLSFRTGLPPFAMPEPPLVKHGPPLPEAPCLIKPGTQPGNSST